MKFKVSFLGLLLAPCVLLAQSDYALFPLDSVFHASEHLEFPSVQLSTSKIGGFTYQTLHPNYNKDFHNPTGDYANLINLQLPLDGCMDWGFAHWLGDSLRYDTNGVYYFENRMGNPYSLATQDTVGSFQVLYIYDEIDWEMIVATVDSIAWHSVGDITDSIKYFTLNRMDSNFNIIPDTINGVPFWVGRSHGLLNSPAFYDYPFKFENMVYQGKYGADTLIQHSNRYKVWNMEIGDEFHTWWHMSINDYNPDHKKEIIITDKSWSPTEHRFIYTKHIKHEKIFLVYNQDPLNPAFLEEIEFSETDETDTIYLDDYLFLDDVLYGILEHENINTNPVNIDFSTLKNGKSAFNDSLFKIGFQSHHFNSNFDLQWCEHSQSPQGDPNYFIEGCGGFYYDTFNEVTGPEQQLLTYIHKGNYEWGEPFNLSIDELEENNFVLYPNPSNGWVYIRIDQQTSGILRLVDLSGRSLAEMESNAEQTIYTLDVSDYAPGIYFIEHYSKGKKLKAEKLILQ